MTVKRIRQARPWPNEVTTKFWAGLAADAKCMAYWTKYTQAHYRRSLKDEPLPGNWPKYTARSEIAMAIFEALEQRTKQAPRGFFSDGVDRDIQEVDCYAIAERLLNDELVRKLGDGPARTEKKVRKKRVRR